MTTLALLVTAVLTSPGVGVSPGCPEARALRTSGALERAEHAARACLAEAPDDAGALFELSRALGHQQRYDEALRAVEAGLELYPEDVDLALWRVRIMAWSGDLPRARAAMTQVRAAHPEVVADRETAMLVADLHYWSRDWRGADDALSQYLAAFPGDADAHRKRGLAHLESGDTVGARADLEAGCRLGGEHAPSCGDLRDLARRESIVELAIEATGATSARGEELRTSVGASVRPFERLRLGLGAELRMRGAGDAPLDEDVVLTATSAWRGDGFSIEGGVGVGPGASFSPLWSAWLEPAAALATDVWMRVRAWRIAYADAGALVISPALALRVATIDLDLRYHLGLPDGTDLSDPTHAGLVLARAGGETFWVQAGAGGGTGVDYLAEISLGGADRGHWLGLVALGWRPAVLHELRLGYALRTEWSGASGAARRHELTLSWRAAL